MGVYAEVEITIELNTDVGEIAYNLADKVTEHIKSQGTEVFDFDLSEVDTVGGTLYIKLASDRYQNAQWRAEQVLEYFKANHLDLLEEYTADMITPDNIIYWNKEDES